MREIGSPHLKILEAENYILEHALRPEHNNGVQSILRKIIAN